jgi:hypothetical protein
LNNLIDEPEDRVIFRFPIVANVEVNISSNI